MLSHVDDSILCENAGLHVAYRQMSSYGGIFVFTP